MTTRTIEGEVDFTIEDGGCAVVAEVGHDNEVFVRIQEWHDEPEQHVFVPLLDGKRVRITIEVVE